MGYQQWGPNPSVLWGKLSCEFSAGFMSLHAMRFMVRLCLTYPFRCWGVWFIWCVWVAQLVSGCLSKEISLCVAKDSVCLWEVVSGFSCVAILKQKNIFQFLITNAASPTFLLGWVMILCGKKWISVIELKSDSGCWIQWEVLRIP